MIVDLLEEKYVRGFSLDTHKGKIVHFTSNAQTFVLNFECTNFVKGSFQQFGITAREGITILIREYGEQHWRNLEVLLHRESGRIFDLSKVIKNNKKYECIIYGPILAELVELTLEIENSELEQIESYGNMLFLGGRIAFGIGASSQSFRVSNILSRQLNLNAYSLSFRDLPYLEQIYKVLNIEMMVNKYEFAFLEVHEIKQDYEDVRKYLPQIIDKALECSKKLILWICKQMDEETNEIIDYCKHICDINENIIFVDCSYIFGPEYSEMCTYSLNYINDAGMYHIYKSIVNEMEDKWNI